MAKSSAREISKVYHFPIKVLPEPAMKHFERAVCRNCEKKLARMTEVKSMGRCSIKVKVPTWKTWLSCKLVYSAFNGSRTWYVRCLYYEGTLTNEDPHVYLPEEQQTWMNEILRSK